LKNRFEATPMQMEDMKIFCDVVRLNSFSRGARENRVTQSCVSQIMQKLELQLRILLIDRSRRPWRLTSQGRAFFNGALDLLDRYRRLEQEVQGRQARVDSVVRVAAIYSAGLGPVNSCVSRFAELRPDTRVQVEYLHPDCVYSRVLDETADLGIVSFPRIRRDLVVLPWREETMVLVCPPAHRLAKARSAPLPALRDEPFVGFSRDLVIRRQVDRFLKQHHVQVNVVFEFDNIEAIKRAVEVGSGVSILPRPTLDREVESGTLKAVPLAARRLVRPLGIIRRRRKRLHADVEQFVHLLQGIA
jgi:DNA-binding transcriptional LysR family regulator